MSCAQELCGNWSGDGSVCPCALLDVEARERPIVVPDVHYDHDIHGLVIEIHRDGSTSLDEDCNCPRDCAGCEREDVLRA